eukprot:1178200-Prorocentrum_minimum.AAC.9
MPAAAHAHCVRHRPTPTGVWPMLMTARGVVDAREPQNTTKSEEYHRHLQGVLYSTGGGGRGDEANRRGVGRWPLPGGWVYRGP